MIRRRSFAASIAIALALAGGAPSSWAQGIDLTQGGPIQITSRDGIEWRQAEQVVIAKGDAKVVRGTVTVTADRLMAWYRRKGDPAAPQQVSTGLNGATETEGNEVYRMRAEGNVHIRTETDNAWGDQATFDLDESVMVMTGRALKLTTPTDTLTARDTLEYWSQKHLAVARGDAVVVTSDARRIAADTIAAYTVETAAPGTAGAPGAVPAPSGTARPGQAAGDSMAALAGKLQRVEAFNNVSIRTQTDIVTGDRGVYVPDTGIARLGGHVRITRGSNQINGSEAVVNMKTGVATLLAGDTGRVSGLVIPNDPSGPPPPPEALPKPPREAAKPGGTTQGYTMTAPADDYELGDLQIRETRMPLKVLRGDGGLVARGVGKTYHRRPVVRNVSVYLNRGEAVGLLGPNGAGKTTTFYMIVGLVTPDTGSIHLDGADITTLPMYRRARLGIGYLPQEASVFRGLNVEQNVMAALEVVEPDLATRRLMLDELLGEFGIGHLRRTPALALSGGERRRVEIARALATQPAYILLDEPLAGIDPIAVSEIRDLVKHLKDRGIGVLITDHNVRETLEIIDRAYIMHDGQVLMEGTPAEVVAHRDVRRVYLGERFSL